MRTEGTGTGIPASDGSLLAEERGAAAPNPAPDTIAPPTFAVWGGQAIGNGAESAVARRQLPPWVDAIIPVLTRAAHGGSGGASRIGGIVVAQIQGDVPNSYSLRPATVLDYAGEKLAKFAPRLALAFPEIKKKAPNDHIEVGRVGDIEFVCFDSICLVEFHMLNGQVDSMTSVYQPAFVAYVMKQVLKQDDYNSLIGRTKGTALDLSVVKPDDVREVERMIAARTHDADAIAEANRTPPNYAGLKLNPSNTRAVLEGEWAIARAKSTQFQLATFGAGPCVIVAAWNPGEKKAVLAHVDALTDLGSVRHVLDEVASGRGTSKIQVHLAGGEESSKELQAGLIKMIKQDPDTMELVSADLGSSESDSLTISAENGKIATGISRSQVDLGADADKRLKRVEERLQSARMKLTPALTPLTMIPER
jgi:hypothetical protein